MNSIEDNEIIDIESITESDENNDIDIITIEDTYLEKVRKLYESLMNTINIDSPYYDPKLFKKLTFDKFLRWYKANF